MMPTALLDGDILAFRAAAACQSQSPDWGDGAERTVHADAQEAADAACRTVAAWAALARCKDVIVCFTGRNNFRKRVLSTYKANRAGKVKPLAYVYTVEAVQARFPWRLVDGLEADDLMGVLVTTGRFLDGQGIVVTVDKDLRGVPGWHLNPLKEDKPVAVSERQADKAWLMQVLTGDTSDGYTGIPGVGPKKAEKALFGASTVEAMWALVVSAYRSARLTEADALVQARVARILRRQDYDKSTKEVLLWHPTTPERMSIMPAAETPATAKCPASPASSPSSVSVEPPPSSTTRNAP